MNASPASRPLRLALCLASSFALPAAGHAQAAAVPAAPAAAPQGPAFDILEYEIVGNTVLDAATIELAVQDHLGPGRRMSDVEEARAALEAAYQKAGFLTVGVDIPEQRIEDGVVRLAVAEGSVHAVYVTGSRYHSQDRIRTRVPELEPGRVPDFNRVQQQLADLGREDRRVQPVLRPGRLPGTVDIDLQVADSLPAGASIELNNQHAAGTTPVRLLASGHYDNLFQRDHTLSFTLQTAPEKPSESEVAVANYGVPVDDGDTLATNVVVSNSNVDTLGGTQVIGKGFTLGLRWQHPVGYESGYWSFSAGFDYKDLRQRTQFGADGVSTPLRYLPFQFGIFGQWAAGPDRASFNGTGTFALAPIFRRDIDCPAAGGFTRQDQFSCNHQGSDGSFGAIKGDLRLAHQFGPASVAVRMGAQFASQPLVSAEQYALGGADTVRGYDEGEASGDEGALFSAELRTANLATPFGAKAAERIKDLSLLAFVDAGLTYVIDPAAGQPGHVALLGLGTGARISLRSGLDGQLDVAWPQKPTPNSPRSDARVHARVAWVF
jgi:hemolysin activation/secretion protein